MNTPSASASPTRALWLLCGAYFAMGTSTMAVIGGLPQIAAGLHETADAVSNLVAAFAVTFAFAAPALQVALGHLDRKKMVIAGLAVSACATLACALCASYVPFFAARVAVALGCAAIGPVASALGASLVAPAVQGRALATVFLGMTLSSVLATPACAWAAEAFGWKPMLVAVAGLDGVIALLVLAGVPAGSRGQRLVLRDLFAVFMRPGLMSALGVIFFHVSALFASYTLIVPLLHERFGMGAGLVSACLSTFGIAGVLGNFIVRRVSVRWSADRALFTAVAALIAVYSVFGMLHSHSLAALGFLAMASWAVCHDIFMPSQQRRLVELAPDVRGLVLALNSSALYIGMSVGASVAAVVDGRIGLAALPWASAVLSALALVTLLVSRRSVRLPVAALAR